MATLGRKDSLYNLQWDRSETLVGVFLLFCVVSIGFLLFQSLICRALFPKVLQSMVLRVVRFGHYSVTFEERSDGQYCFVRTWEGISLLCLCGNVEAPGQRVPHAELSSLLRVVSSLPSGLMTISIRGGSPSLLRNMGAERSDGRRFIVAREFSSEMFLHWYRVAHQEIFGMLKVTTMIDYLMLRLRGALQEPWMEDVPALRRCVVAGRVTFAELRSRDVSDLVIVWDRVCAYVRYTGPRHIKSAFDKVRRLHFRFLFAFFFRWLRFTIPLDCDRNF